MLKLIKTIPKYISTLNYTTTPSKWDPIYKLPSIQSLSAIAKLKIYAAGLTAITVPVCGVTHTLGLFHPQLLPISATLGIATTIAFALLGRQLQNLIGFMYVNNSDVKISYLDGWGRRRNVEIPIDDIVPLSEVPRSFSDSLYLKVKRYSTDDVYKLHLLYGEILERKQLQILLGEYNKDDDKTL